MPFRTDLVVRAVDAESWELERPLIYHGQVDEWIVPAGFSTDFASVPAITAWLVPRTGVYPRAAVLHDWFCRVGIQWGVINPVDADGVFRRVLGELGVGTVLRWWIWAGVRWSARTDPRRQAGWWTTAPRLAVVTASALPFLLPPALVIWPAIAAYRAVERAAARHDDATSRTPLMPLITDLTEMAASRARRFQAILAERRGRPTEADGRAAPPVRVRVTCPECGTQHWHRTPKPAKPARPDDDTPAVDPAAPPV
jgi:hypothetical protein